MNDLPFPEEADGIAHIRFLHQTQNVVVGGAGFLLCCQILKQICDGIALGLELTGIEGDPARRLGPDPGRMVDIIGSKALGLQLLCRKVSRELVHNGCDHFQMGQLLGADIRKHCLLLPIGHGIPLGKITHGRSHLTVWATILANDQLCQPRVGLLDIYRVLKPFFIPPHINILLPRAIFPSPRSRYSL